MNSIAACLPGKCIFIPYTSRSGQTLNDFPITSTVTKPPASDLLKLGKKKKELGQASGCWGSRCKKKNPNWKISHLVLKRPSPLRPLATILLRQREHRKRLPELFPFLEKKSKSISTPSIVIILQSHLLQSRETVAGGQSARRRSKVSVRNGKKIACSR